MKKTIVFMTALLVMAVLFASCSNGMGEKADGSGSAYTKAVKVNLSLGGEIANVAQKEVALTGDAKPSTFLYYYQATPNWKNAGNTAPANAAGKTDGFVKIPYAGEGHDYEDDFSLGYFTPGDWAFAVEVRIPDPQGQQGDEIVLYEGSLEHVTISNPMSGLTIPMTLKTEGATQGELEIVISVPVISGSTKVVMTVDNNEPIDEQDIETASDKSVTSPTNKALITRTGWKTFTTTIDPIGIGTHTVVLEYKNGNDSIGGAAVAFTAVNGGNYLVCGTIENGQYQIVALTLTGIDPIELSMTPDTTEIGQDGTLVYEVTDRWSDDNDGTYTWYLNGVETSNNHANKWKFTVDTTVPGVYEITCKVDKNDGNTVASVSKTVTVNPASTINIVTKIENKGKNIKVAPADAEIVCTPVNLPNSGSVAWYVKKDAGNLVLQEDGVDDQTNVFTFDSTTSTTKTTQTGTYKIVCKVTNAGVLTGYGEKTITIE